MLPLWLEVDGLRMHARTWRSGKPPLVMPHGLVISSRYLAPVAQELAAEFDVYAPDLPGFGRSDKPRRALDVAGLAEALARWMDASGVPSAPMLANSLGCQIVVELAAREPGRVERAVLCGPTMDPSAGALRQVSRLLADAPRERPALWLAHVPDYAHAGLPRALATFRAARAHPMLERAAQVRCPVLVVRGADDPIAPRLWCDRVARACGGALVEVEGGHVLNWTHPRRLAGVALPFLLGKG